MARRQVKPRKVRADERQSESLLPHERLAVAIVEQAVDDARTVLAKANRNPLSLVSHWELCRFFKSKWCATLLGTTDLDGNEIAERLGLYVR